MCRRDVTTHGHKDSTIQIHEHVDSALVDQLYEVGSEETQRGSTAHGTRLLDAHGGGRKQAKRLCLQSRRALRESTGGQ